MSPSYPAHASPRPEFSSQLGRTVSEYDLHSDSKTTTTSTNGSTAPSTPPPQQQNLHHPRPSNISHPPLVSPSFTPPLTPNGSLNLNGIANSIPSRTTIPATSSLTDPSSTLTDQDVLAQRESEHSASPPPALTPLPTVTCEVRARIPTTTGQEMFLHLYHNSADNKEHLAIVFGPYIRSKSLDAPREGETEKDRMIRGAYVGTLFPGRTTSRRVDAIKREAGVAGSDSSSGPVLPMSPVQVPQKSDAEKEAETQKTHAADEDPPQAVDPTKEAPYVRIHSECYTGETVWSARCDCGEQLDEAARIMSLSPYGGRSPPTFPLPHSPNSPHETKY